VSPGGKQLTLDIYEKGTILGDMSLLGQDRLAESYDEGIDDGVIYTISPGDLRKLIERYPVVGVNIIPHLFRRLQSAERELEAMAYQRVDQRLARKLLDLGQRFGASTVRGTLIHPAHATGDGRDAEGDRSRHWIVARDALAQSVYTPTRDPRTGGGSRALARRHTLLGFALTALALGASFVMLPLFQRRLSAPPLRLIPILRGGPTSLAALPSQLVGT
jgi:hypothetical protein